ncbi:MAG: phosphopyruvate hydratase [Sphingomonadaceae bacterium]|nr:phosphopyruvate hydratase [Sphingomonadaceae bacterium]
MTIVIEAVKGREILDSRGRPTIEVDVAISGGFVGTASVPSGASTSRSEACELRDGEPTRFFGRGVAQAAAHVNEIIGPTLYGQPADAQRTIDDRMRELDGTAHLGRLGANAILGVSLAACRAAALARGLPLYRHIGDLAAVSTPLLPVPMVNILSGGLHAGRGMDVQDFLAVPLSAPDYPTALHDMIRVRAAAEDLARTEGMPTLLADEGGLSPGYARAEQALDLMVRAIEAAGFEPGSDIAIALDIAATSLLGEADSYALRRSGLALDSADMIDLIASWVGRYPIVSVEDGLHDEDWQGWSELTQRLGDIQVIGDDLFATSPARLARGVGVGAANAVLIKLNQNGTLSGTLDAVALARQHGYATVISARSGETSDSFMSDLAVGTAGGQIKIGSVRNSERLEKYNQLLRIAERETIGYAGSAVLAGAQQRGRNKDDRRAAS